MSAARWTDAAVDVALRDLAALVEFPASPALATAVGDRLRAEAGRPVVRERRRGWLPAPRRALVAATLALVVAMSAVLAASPAAREAVARWLGLRGVRVETVPTLPPVPSATGSPARTPIAHLLGAEVGLAEARARAGFHVVVPRELGAPDQVFFDDRLPGGRVTLAYLATGGLPASEHTGYGLLLSQFRGSVDQEYAHKFAEVGGVEQVTVGGGPGFWLGLESHVLLYLGPGGERLTDTMRVAGPTLLWERGPVTLRLEGDISRETAIRIASSVR